MRIVLTGATGFLGKAITQTLMAEGHEVCALMRPESDKVVQRELNLKNTITYTSLMAPEVVDLLTKWKPETMIHLAWKGVTGKQRNDAVHFTENIPLTLDAINLAYSAGCSHWVGMGSQAEYGIPNKKANEEQTCYPISAYGRAKLATGIASLGLCEALLLKATWCRVFSVYGPEDHPTTFIAHIIQSFQNNESPALSACEQRWDFLYITDAAAAIYELVKRNCSGVYNIGSGNTVQLKEVVENIKKEMESEQVVGYGVMPYVAQQIMHLQADISKLKKDTGWYSKVSLSEGLQKTILSFQNKFQNESI